MFSDTFHVCYDRINWAVGLCSDASYSLLTFTFTPKSTVNGDQQCCLPCMDFINRLLSVVDCCLCAAVSQPKRNFNTMCSPKELTSESSISRSEQPVKPSSHHNNSHSILTSCLKISENIKILHVLHSCRDRWKVEMEKSCTFTSLLTVMESKFIQLLYFHKKWNIFTLFMPHNTVLFTCFSELWVFYT